MFFKFLLILLFACTTQAHNHKDNFAKTITLFGIRKYIVNNNTKIINCYKKEKPNYDLTIKEFISESTDVANNIDDYFGNQNVKLRNDIEKTMRTYGEIMKKFPLQFWDHIENKRWTNAADFMMEYKNKVSGLDKTFSNNLKLLKSKVPAVFKKLQQHVNKLCKETETKTKSVLTSIKDCIESPNMKA